MISYNKALPFLSFFVFSLSTHVVSGHGALPKDFNMEKFQAELEELRADSTGNDFLDGHEYIAPGPDDERSPCPFINIFANHGFINRNGRDIPLFDIGKLAFTVYDFPPEAFDIATNTAIYSGQAVVQENGDTLINLDRLWDRPGLEHDASIVFPNPGEAWPKDLLTGGAPMNTEPNSDITFQKFRRTIDDDLLDNLLSKNPGSDILRMEDMNSHLYDRILDSRRDDPFFLWGSLSRFAVVAQYFLPVLILGESKDDFTEVPKEYIKTLFAEDRLPDGYMPRSLRFPDFDVIKYLTAAGVAAGELYGTAMKAETADLVGESDDASNLRGHVTTDTI